MKTGAMRIHLANRIKTAKSRVTSITDVADAAEETNTLKAPPKSVAART
ncbi:MAG: hypothetical protein IKU61_01800 [Clostridia bacterium]|nr:hypothetical protein [Clostridia bacterium]